VENPGQKPAGNREDKKMTLWERATINTNGGKNKY